MSCCEGGWSYIKINESETKPRKKNLVVLIVLCHWLYIKQFTEVQKERLICYHYRFNYYYTLYSARLRNAWFLRATPSHGCRVASLHTAKNMTSRFATSTEQEINKSFEDKDSESLKRYTKTAQEVFHGRCKISLIAYLYLLFWKIIECVSCDWAMVVTFLDECLSK